MVISEWMPTALTRAAAPSYFKLFDVRLAQAGCDMKCYAYLSDVENVTSCETLHGARWFKCGWTLQELIAPAEVAFFHTH